MFFIFSYDLLLFAVLLVLYLFMFILFPMFTLLLTGLCIWGLVVALRGRDGGEADE